MQSCGSLNHTKCDCKCHVVFIPKRRKKTIYGSIREHLGEVFHEVVPPQAAATGRLKTLCGMY